MITPELLSSTKRHEGLRLRAYQDHLGVWTIGYGTNLQELAIDEDLATEWLHDKLKQAQVSAGGFPWFANLNGARQDAIVEMIYNLGLPRFSKFSKLCKALAGSDFHEAAEQMLDSDWHKQVGKRAERLAEQMRAGSYWQ